MRAKELKDLLYGLLHLLEDFNPMNYIFLKEKLEINLLNGRILYPEKDDIYKHYKKKVEWFKERINVLNGDLNDIKEAKIKAFGHKEEIKIMFKDKKFEGEILFKQVGPNAFSTQDKLSWRDNNKLKTR